MNGFDAVNHGRRAAVSRAARAAFWNRAVRRLVFGPRTAAAEVHQHLIDRQAVEPRGERRLAAEAADAAQQREERLLRQVFGVRRVAGHAQGDAVDQPAVAVVNLLEGRRVAPRR
jgi:hypothetical protein